MTKIAGLLQKTTKFLKIIFGTEVYEGGRGFLATKGANREKKKCKKEKCPEASGCSPRGLDCIELL